MSGNQPGANRQSCVHAVSPKLTKTKVQPNKETALGSSVDKSSALLPLGGLQTGQFKTAARPPAYLLMQVIHFLPITQC